MPPSRATWERIAAQAIGKTDFDFSRPDLAQKFYSDEQALLKSGTAIIDLEEPGFDKVTGMARTVVHIQGAAAR